MKLNTLSLSFCLLLLLSPICLSADPRHSHGGFGKEHPRYEQMKRMRDKLFESLELNAEQKKALKEFRGKRKDMRDMALDIKDLRTEISLMLKKPGSPAKEIKAKVKEATDLMTKMSEARVDNLLALRKELTPQQFKKIMRFGESMKERMKGGFQSRGGFGSGNRQGPSGPGAEGELDLPDLYSNPQK